MDKPNKEQPIKESQLDLAVNQWFDLILATLESRKVKNGMGKKKYGNRKAK